MSAHCEAMQKLLYFVAGCEAPDGTDFSGASVSLSCTTAIHKNGTPSTCYVDWCCRLCHRFYPSPSELSVFYFHSLYCCTTLLTLSAISMMDPAEWLDGLIRSPLVLTADLAGSLADFPAVLAQVSSSLVIRKHILILALWKNDA